MSYRCCIIRLKFITQKMFLYVVYYLSPLIQTVYTRTVDRNISHPYPVEFFPRKISRTIQPLPHTHGSYDLHSSNFNPSNNSVILTKLFRAWKPHFFHYRCDPIPFRKTFFIVDSYIKVKSFFLDLTKFRQHFALISKYMTWKWWHEFHHNQVCT